ncbi:MAG: hypothetical protein M1415_10050 [Firmicutes bacterium]|nr:hypothetical protein [Bacillota bacterium]
MVKKRWMSMMAIVLGLGGLGAAPALSHIPTAPPLWALAQVGGGKSSGAPTASSLYRSTDGGVDWSPLTSTFTGFSMPTMLTATDGFLSGVQTNGDPYYESTGDGGVSWSRTKTKDLATLGFLNASQGWRSMTNMPIQGKVQWRLLTTNNGGRTWTPVLTRFLPEVSVTSAPFFISPTVGWILDIIGPQWNVFRTTNGGHSFTRLTAQTLGGAGESPVGITFTTKSRGWTLVESIGAGGAGLNALLTTNDGGVHWTTDTGLPKVPTVEHFDFLNATEGFVLTPMKTVSTREGFTPYGTDLYVTTNGGKTWSLRYQSPGQTLRNIVFVNANLAYATSLHSLLESTNGGRAWRVVYRNAGITFQALESTNRISRLSQ